MNDGTIPREEKDRLSTIINRLDESSMVGFGDVNREDNCNGYIERIGEWEIRFTRDKHKSWNLRMQLGGMTYVYTNRPNLRSCRKLAYEKLLSFIPAVDVLIPPTPDPYDEPWYEADDPGVKAAYAHLKGYHGHKELSPEFFAGCFDEPDDTVNAVKEQRFRDEAADLGTRTHALLQELLEWDDHRYSPDYKALTSAYEEFQFRSHKAAWDHLRMSDDPETFLSMISLCPKIPRQEKHFVMAGVTDRVVRAAIKECSWLPWLHWASCWLKDPGKTPCSCLEMQKLALRTEETLRGTEAPEVSYTTDQLDTVWWVLDFLDMYMCHGLSVRQHCAFAAGALPVYHKDSKHDIKGIEDLMDHWYKRVNPFSEFVTDPDVWEIAEELDVYYKAIKKVGGKVRKFCKSMWEKVTG